MSYLDPSRNLPPRGLAKVLAVHWALVLLLCAVAAFGALMLYSVAGGSFDPWASRQITRFGAALAAMFIVAFVPIHVWRLLTPYIFGITLLMLVAVPFVGSVGMGAQRWLDLGVISLQPSEAMKIALIMVLALYYDWLQPERVSHPFWVALPVALILAPTGLVAIQPDLGTAVLLMLGGAAVMFLAGVSLWYFVFAGVLGGGGVTAILVSRGTEWQLLRDYQYRRIDTFLDPSLDPLGQGYHITQSKIALGSGGMSGRGFMEGTQSRLNFLPEKHTDFIFTTLAEEFGLVGSLLLLILYGLIILFVASAAMRTRNRFGALIIGGVGAVFFLFFAVNMAMVMGLIPVVGVPLPLVSYGGSAMLVLMGAFGLVQSAYIHRPRGE